ncbi:hypothetical protein L204_102572 [Cryptococcus depauperatus]
MFNPEPPKPPKHRQRGKKKSSRNSLNPLLPTASQASYVSTVAGGSNTGLGISDSSVATQMSNAKEYARRRWLEDGQEEFTSPFETANKANSDPGDSIGPSYQTAACQAVMNQSDPPIAVGTDTTWEASLLEDLRNMAHPVKNDWIMKLEYDKRTFESQLMKADRRCADLTETTRRGSPAAIAAR